MKLQRARLLALCLAWLVPTAFSCAVRAADLPTPSRAPSPAVSTDTLEHARALIAAQQWSDATEELRRVDDRKSADWNNLMGYTLRKGSAPDLAASERYYEEALRIDPHHRNALEYSGELSLMKGDLDKAQARLAALAVECPASCEQYVQLQSAIVRYRAAGNKFVATTW